MKSKSFRLLCSSQVCANLGDVFYIVGLIALLYAATSSALYLALLPFCNMLGRFFGSLISPILIDKYRLKSLLLASQVGKTVVICTVYLLEHTNDSHFIWLIVGCILCNAFLDGWATPAADAMMPRLVAKNDLLKSNSLMSIINETVQLAGWALGGVLVTLINGENVILLTFILFVISVAMILFIKDQTSKGNANKQKTWSSLQKGWKRIWFTPLFRSITIMICIETAANAVWIAAILYVFVFNVLQVSNTWWGYINTVFFCGLILGGMVCHIFANRIEKHIRSIVICSSFAIAVITFLFGVNTNVWLALLFVSINGMLEQLKGITIHTYLQKEATNEDLPKIYSAQNALVSLVFACTTLIFGKVADIDVRWTFIIASILLFLSSVYLVIVRSRFQKVYITSEIE